MRIHPGFSVLAGIEKMEQTTLGSHLLMELAKP